MSQIPLLLIDDDPDIATALTDTLEHDEYAVTWVSTGEEAIEKIEERHFTIALLDVGLPDVDGRLVLRVLHEHDPSLPIIVLTAFDTPEKTTNMVAHGAFAYHCKPYRAEELKITLRHALEARVRDSHPL